MFATPAEELPEFMRDERDVKERGVLKTNAQHNNQHDGPPGNRGQDGNRHGLLAVTWVKRRLHVHPSGSSWATTTSAGGGTTCRPVFKRPRESWDTTSAQCGKPRVFRPCFPLRSNSGWLHTKYTNTKYKY